ncbi:MAG: lateral flagellin LafA [Rubricoccaceae bacterium]
MSFRINTNTQSSMALSALSRTTNEIGARQLRLATGSQINSAADDSAGYTISKKLNLETRAQGQALSNIGDAKSVLSVAEGGLNSIQDILSVMKEKVVQAGNDSLGTEERAAIQSQLDELGAEIDDIVDNTTFNGNNLLSDGSGGASTALTFQVGAAGSDTYATDAVDLSTNVYGVALDVETDAASRLAAIDAIDTAVSDVSAAASGIGDDQNRLDFKAQNLETLKTNYEAANSRIEDADFAKEQMEVVKLQILQQTGSAMFAQANASGQSVLSFF